MLPILLGLAAVGTGLYLATRPKGPTPAAPGTPVQPANYTPPPAGGVASLTDIFNNSQNAVGLTLSSPDLGTASIGSAVNVAVTALSDGAIADTTAVLAWLATDRSRGVIRWNPASGDLAAKQLGSALTVGGLYFIAPTHVMVDNHPLDPVYADPNATTAQPAVHEDPNPVVQPVAPVPVVETLPTAKVMAPDGLNVRVDPNENSAVVANNDAKSGTIVLVIDSQQGAPTAAAPNGWIHVRTPGHSDGWASAQWLELTGDFIDPTTF